MSSTTSQLANEIVRAGAGAGKTTRLTKTVLEFAQQFIKEHKRLPRLVVTTFTRKATQELRERLVREAVKSENRDLLRLVTSKSDLHISTIHGVLTLFLRRYGQWLGLDSGFSILEPAAAGTLARKTLRDCLVEHPQGLEIFEDHSLNRLLEILQSLQEMQLEDPRWQALSAQELQQILEKQYRQRAQKVMALVHKIEAECQNEGWLDYLQACGAFLQREVIAWADLQAWYNETQKPRFSRQKPQFSEDLHDDFVAELEALMDLADDTVDVYPQFEERGQVFLELARNFRQKFDERKKALGVMEMSDLERQVQMALRTYPELLKAFSAEWDFWLIDEYQDTSPRQVEILKQLIGQRPVFYVGDPQQSIYLFRGARSEIFNQTEESLARSGGKLSQLQVNYRSRPELLYFLNDFFAQWPQQFQPMQAHAEITNAQTTVAELCISPKGADEPYLGILNFVANGLKQGAKLHDFCVLARTHAELMDVAQYFQKFGYRIHLHSANGFYRRREILDALSFLKFLLNPLDNLNLIRLLRSPWWHWTDQQISELTQNRPLFLWQEMTAKKPNDVLVNLLQKALERSREIGLSDTLFEAMRDQGLFFTCMKLDPSGQREANLWKLYMHMKSQEKTPGFQYLQFINQALDSERLATSEDEGDAVAALEPNRIHFMTIHKAKGLKFKNVIVPNLHRGPRLSQVRGHELPIICDDGTWRMSVALRLGEERKLKHHIWSRTQLQLRSEKEKEEHLRLLYVALTRAEDKICLHWCDKPESNSWLARLRWDTSEGLHRGPAYQYEVRREFTSAEEWSGENDTLSTLRAPFRYTAPHNLKRLSVTKLLEGDGGPAPKRATAQEATIPKSKKQIEAPVFGLKLHTYLERLRYHQGLSLQQYSERWFKESKTQFVKAVDYVLKLQVPPIAELVRTGEVEWGFQLATHFGVLEGQIDLWGVVSPVQGGEVAWVVDYKSGSARHTEKAFAQLELYAWALKQHGVKAPIKMAVIYALEEKTEVREYNDAQDIWLKYKIN